MRVARTASASLAPGSEAQRWDVVGSLAVLSTLPLTAKRDSIERYGRRLDPRAVSLHTVEGSGGAAIQHQPV
jgi:hypothetical protein